MTAGRCTGCGHDGRPEARYCVRCGLPHLAAGWDGSGSGGLEDAADVVDPFATGRSRDATSSRLWTSIATGVLLLAAGSFLGWRLVAPDPEAEPGPETEPSAEVATKPPPDEVTLIDLPAADVPRRKGLAGLAGHQVFVSHSLGLLRLDTDSGTVTRYDRSQVPGSLVGRFRDQLIMVEEPNRIVAVPVAEPTATPTVVLEFEQSSISVARMIDDHRLVVLAWRFRPQPRPDNGRYLVDLLTGEVSDIGPGWEAHDLNWVPAGGLFEVTADGYRHVADGIALVTAENRLLVRDCDGPDDCTNRWIDRRTGSTVDQQVPPGDSWSMEAIDADGRLLFLNSEDGHRYFDTEHGWLLPGNVIRGSAGSYFQDQVEDVVGDGRYLLTPTAAGIVVYDLTTHDGYVLDVGDPEPRGVTRIIAVPKPNRWVDRS